jgi:hypothetical protein
VNEILQPIGGSVRRGLSMVFKSGVLVRQNYQITRRWRSTDPSGPREESESWADVTFAQEPQRDLAKMAKTTVLHINTGLFELGRSD